MTLFLFGVYPSQPPSGACLPVLHGLVERRHCLERSRGDFVFGLKRPSPGLGKVSILRGPGTSEHSSAPIPEPSRLSISDGSYSGPLGVGVLASPRGLVCDYRLLPIPRVGCLAFRSYEPWRWGRFRWAAEPPRPSSPWDFNPRAFEPPSLCARRQASCLGAVWHLGLDSCKTTDPVGRDGARFIFELRFA